MIIKSERIKSLDNPKWESMESITINDNEEPLVPISMSSLIKCYPIYYKMGVEHSIPECFVRQSVFEKLLEAAKVLPKGINLVVLDGWRPFLVQEYLFNTFFKYLRNNPLYQDSSEEFVREMARNIVSPPRTNIKSPSPHLTGGAVDVTLSDHAGRLLDMGTNFDENSPLSWTSALENTEGVSQDAITNRRVLYHALTSVGFTNLPSEWWHYDYGDQLWAYYNKEPSAIYGVTYPMTLEYLWNTSNK